MTGSDENNVKTRFTVDTDISGTTEMPSISRLLNRKKLAVSESYTDSFPAKSGLTPTPRVIPSPPSPPSSNNEDAPSQLDGDELLVMGTPGQGMMEELPEEIDTSSVDPTEEVGTSSKTLSALQKSTDSIEKSQTLTEPGSKASAEIVFDASDEPLPSVAQEESITHPTESVSTNSQPQIRKSSRKGKKKSSLILWDKTLLQKSTDPLAKGILSLLEGKYRDILFLAIAPPPRGSSLPIFLGTAAVNEANLKELWDGIRWDPRLVPELWESFKQTGLIELAPPGEVTDSNSNRNIVRSAFGIHAHEWLTLLRAGPTRSCRGILAIVSSKPIGSLLQQVTSQVILPLQAPTQRAKAA